MDIKSLLIRRFGHYGKRGSETESAVKIENLQIEKGKRILVTSDIHGHADHLQKVLEKARFSDDDILIIVGDIIEKGPESLKTLRYVMGLCERGNVYSVLGNVDMKALNQVYSISEKTVKGFYKYIRAVRARFGTCFFDELTGELGYICKCPDDILKAKDEVLNRFKNEFDFLLNLPTVLETQNYIFVHGGLRDKNLGDNGKREAFELMKYDKFMDTKHCFEKYIIVGHWPVSLYCHGVPRVSPIINREKKIISIDGGCGLEDYGQLNLLIIPDIDCGIEEIYHISYDGLPVYRALTAQEESKDSLYIPWIDNKIRILEKGGEFSYIYHFSTKRKLWIPNSYILNRGHCINYTDYALPVQSGDLISVIEKTSKGYIAKKDETFGWYYGELEKTE